VEVDKTQYVNVNLSIPANTTPGDYRAAIEITHNYGKAEIPVLVKIEGNEKKENCLQIYYSSLQPRLLETKYCSS